MERATVTTTGLNLHHEPHRLAKLVDQLQHGDEVAILRRDGIWLKVKVTKTKTGIGVGEEGWLDSRDVKVFAIDPEPRVEPRVVVETSFPLWWVIAGIGAAVLVGLIVRALW